MDEASARPGERIPFDGSEALLPQLQRALDVGLDRCGTVVPAIGIDTHALARCAAQQIIDRHSGVLANDVPKRDLDGAPGRQQFHRAASRRKIVENNLAGVADAEGAAADHVRRHGAQAFVHHLVTAARDIGFAPAVQPIIRFHAAEQQVLAGAGMQDERFDALDLHARVPYAASLVGWLRPTANGGSGTGSMRPKMNA